MKVLELAEEEDNMDGKKTNNFKSRLPRLTTAELNDAEPTDIHHRRLLVRASDSKIPMHARTLEHLRLLQHTNALPSIPSSSRNTDRSSRRRKSRVSNFLVKSKNLIKITGKELIRFPMEIFEIPGIENLILSPEREACLSFKLPRLPKEIGKMTDLKSLILDTNELEELPIEINKLQNLETLVLSNNNLETLPDQFRQLNSLTDLHLANNRFVDFPHEICHLPKLKFLDLSDNRLEELASEIWLLSSTLVSLLLVYNELRKLPITFSSLSSLKTLWLGHNKLTKLPEDFGDLTKLEWNIEPCSANIDQNPLVRPPLDICQRGVAAIRRYFEELEILERNKKSSRRQKQKTKRK